MTEKILFVDDEQHILDTMRALLRKRYAVSTALGPEEALRLVDKEGPFAVVISDYKMPRMNGIKLLTRIGEISPSTVRIVLTGYADTEAAVGAINEGQVFRFLTKPCPVDNLSRALDAALEQYRLVNAEKELLRGTLRGSIKILTEILSLVNPEAFGRAERIKRTVNEIVAMLNLANPWKYELAAMLSQIGCVSIPEDILAKKYSGTTLSPEEQQIYDMHVTVAVGLLDNIPRMEEVRSIIANQTEAGREQEDIPLGTRLLLLSQEYDDCVQRGLSKADAAAALDARRSVYGEEVFQAFERVVLGKEGYRLLQVPLSGLRPGMILAQDARTPQGMLLLARGLEISGYALERLTNLARTRTIQEPLTVMIPEDSADERQ